MPAGGPPQPWRGGEGAADPVHLPQRGRPVPLHLPEREATEARQRRWRVRQRLRVLEPQALPRSEPGNWRGLGEWGHGWGPEEADLWVGHREHQGQRWGVRAESPSRVPE